MNMSLVSPKSKNPLAYLPRFVHNPRLEKSKPKKKEPSARAKVAKVQSGQKAEKVIHKSVVKKKPPTQEKSSTERYLVGKTLPGFEDHGTVTEILKQGVTRSVRFEDGTVRRVPKDELVGKFNESLRQRGMAKAMESVKADPATGKVTAVLGPRKRPGMERTYSSVARAQAAIRKAYKKP
jgi:hypothetical protein